MSTVLENSPTTTAEIKRVVLELAKKHGLSLSRDNIDFTADKFSELSGNKVRQDNFLDLCARLARNGVISKPESLRLAHAYLRSLK